MRSTGIIRRMDELGRIVLPVEVRRKLDFGTREELEFLIDGDALILKRCSKTCVLCGSATDILKFREKNVCQVCVQALASLE